MSRRRARMAPIVREHFLEAIAYVADRNPAAAANILRKMRELRERLADFPNMGVRGEILGTRRVVMTPYVLTTRMGRDGVEIVAFRHGKQNDAQAPSELLDQPAETDPPHRPDD